MNKRSNLDPSIHQDHELLPEWFLPNGLGGYASGTSSGTLFRKHHGYLVASMNPPTSRVMVLAKTVETLVIGNQTYSLESQKYEDGSVKSDREPSFSLNPLPTYEFAFSKTRLIKQIIPLYGHNAVEIRYTFTNVTKPIKLQIKPFFSWRDHGDANELSTPRFTISMEDKWVELIPQNAPLHRIHCAINAGKIQPNVDELSSWIVPDFDWATGDERLDRHATPLAITCEPLNESPAIFRLVCFVDDDVPALLWQDHAQTYIEHTNRLIANAKVTETFDQRLVIASDLFVAYRKSTDSPTVLAGLPWFTDWGRDTMIAFEGLFLKTNRFLEAKAVLLSFAKYVKNGLIPNMFPDDSTPPMYNTVDASLWYVHAIDRYLEATHDLESVQTMFYPVMKQILHAYETGTDFSISMDHDGLIHAGSGLDQVTWMDVRINGYVVTPRHGKPVEINALWYNALRIVESLSKRLNDSLTYSSHLQTLAERVKTSFNARFWNETNQCLYDVVDSNDPSIRPNQLFAISLKHRLLPLEKERLIVQTAKHHLLDIYGLRSLSLYDPRFKQVYQGPLHLRDYAYHMGTTWGFLMGCYIDALMKTALDPSVAKQEAETILKAYHRHFNEGCINGIAEVFDGYHGIISRGCASQAWSVAEVLRVTREYDLHP